MKGVIDNVVAFPIPRNKKPTHSKKIEWALRNFIASMGGHYYDDEIKDGILFSYFKLDHETCVEQKICIGENDCVCYTTLSRRAPTDDIYGLEDHMIIANRINTKLSYGNFEIDEKTGEIRFRTHIEGTERISPEEIDKFLGYPKHIINEHGHMFPAYIY